MVGTTLILLVFGKAMLLLQRMAFGDDKSKTAQFLV